VSRIIVAGGGVIGLATALMLEKQGHEVTVLERDPAPPPATSARAWDGWNRTGVMQFRQPQILQPRGWQILRTQFPEVAFALAEADAVTCSPLSVMPEGITDRAPRPGDEKFETLNARRPVLEHAIAATAESRIDIRRGVQVTGLLSDRPGHVAGVRIWPGKELKADLVIDATGRRSALPAWLTAIGAAGPAEEAGDSGFIYYSRFFRARESEEPPPFKTPVLTAFDSYSVLTLPSDARTWSVTVCITSRDHALKALREEGNWHRLFSASPLYAHLVAGQDAITGVRAASGAGDRLRSLVVNGTPAATGILAVGDSWAFTTPSLGRGVTLGLMQAEAAADAVSEHLKDPVALALAHDRLTRDRVLPWYRNTAQLDRTRFARITAAIEGRVPAPAGKPADPAAALLRKLVVGMQWDPDMFRAFAEMTAVLALPAEILARPGMANRINEAAAGHQPFVPPGPRRAEVLAMLS
jgi:2-polyprenyl-6-methoxyphenol hydroxylase-like FAD-dependent oxidoreductase